ncbi:MAG: NupC/NupG family nucleoside CNT transporter [Xanthomonadales bacterium]|jgi:CNT family concentrative nucleoside transporter|nr:NupC/NupG family nucleoside CNT transporter [Xanthomonadales bacterium]MDH3924741.1 NupC/NupG family nucleoside CNT transporter [Xanthomonadales bacterium]MDH3941058.1 NupC/NupG family nucleoside CNT transporter [Xanthomonadales bacterium]MDH4001284.1 NupC/NupG family nucleoside CNT transporter [Xanthomonadales bacterium]
MIGTIGFGIFGLAVLISIALTFSSGRKAIDWKLVASGIGLQLLFAIVVILVPGGREFFEGLSSVFVRVISFALDGAAFIFGPLADPANLGFIFAFQVLPTIIFFAALMAVLYHIGLMQKIVQAMAWVMLKVLRISGAESLSVAANVFVGQTEAPLVVRPYISRMTESELFTMMVGGMATIAGGVLAAYITMLGGADEAMRIFYAKHLLSASIMAAPATVVIAKILKPETGESLTRGEVKLHVEKTATNVIEAAANGAADGWRLALNVGAMLLAFIALIAMIDYPLGWLGELTGFDAATGRALSLSTIMGYLLSPLAWVIGVPWADAITVGGLIGEKVVTNEFVAYAHLTEIQGSLSPKAVLISTYALCGFANFSSIAIQIGGIGGIAPERRSDLARLGLTAVLGGTLATMMTATIAGVLTGLV